MSNLKVNILIEHYVPGLVALLKVILSHRHGVIPKNLHFNEPNPNIPSLKDGRLQVVTKNTPWSGGIVGVSAFGFGGANAHVIVKTPSLKQISNPPSETAQSSVPLMLFSSGNTEETVENCLAVTDDETDIASLRKLLERQSRDNLNFQPARGFSIPESDILETCMNEVY